MLKEISVEITRRCPNYCLHCSSSAHSQCSESMPYETFQTVISDAAKLGTKTICLSGGEPFLHDKIVQMIQFVHSKGMECYVYTSGIAMSPSDQRISLPMEQLRQISGAVTKIIFNIEASTEAIYDRIMGTSNCFSLLKESVLRANAAGICTEAHFVPMALNLREIPAVVRLCEELNISKLSFLRLVLHGRAEQNYNTLALTEQKQSELKEYLQKIKTQSGLAIRVGVPLSIDSGCTHCEAASGKLNIRYDGKVFPCEVFKNHSFQKNIKGLQPDSIYQYSLIDIYNHSSYLIRVRELSDNFSDRCETCVGQYLIKMEEKA